MYSIPCLDSLDPHKKEKKKKSELTKNKVCLTPVLFVFDHVRIPLDWLLHSHKRERGNFNLSLCRFCSLKREDFLYMCTMYVYSSYPLPLED